VTRNEIYAVLKNSSNMPGESPRRLKNFP
jgi:hypothetical protein